MKKLNLSHILNQNIVKTQSLSTSLNQADKITLEDGVIYFVKSQHKPNNLLIKEGKELSLLGQFANVPAVIYHDEYYLVLEYLSADNSNQQAELGKILANLHRQEMPYFGFEFDNKIGQTPQQNAVDKNAQNWSEFYWQYRLLPQINLAQKYIDKQLFNALLSLQTCLSALLPENIKPVLLHGDLWSGNVLFSKGKPYLIDPACYYGHSEADLALTNMFGGFSTDFYQNYHQAHPKTGHFEKRKYAYMLYHYLNHVNLFGSSYLSGVKQCLKYLL